MRSSIIRSNEKLKPRCRWQTDYSEPDLHPVGDMTPHAVSKSGCCRTLTDQNFQ